MSLLRGYFFILIITLVFSADPAALKADGRVAPYYALTVDGVAHPVVNGAVVVDGIPHPIQENGTVLIDGVPRLAIPTGKTVVDGVPHPRVDSQVTVDHVPRVTLPGGAVVVDGVPHPPYQAISDSVMKFPEPQSADPEPEPGAPQAQ